MPLLTQYPPSWRRTVLALILTFFVFCPRIMGQSASEISRRDLDAFRTALPQIEATYACLRGHCQITISNDSRLKKPRVLDVDFAADHAMEMARLKASKRPINEIIYCVGEETFFHLVRDLKQPQSGYRVVGISPQGSTREDYIADVGRFLQAPYAVNGVKLSRLMTSPNFRMTGSVEVASEGRRLVQFSFVSGSDEATTWDHPPNGQFLVDPESGWIVRGGKFDMGFHRDPRPLTWEVVYQPNVGDGIPLPSRVVINNGDGEIARCEFVEIMRKGTPVEEFSMPFYGLPDITRPVPAPHEAWPWLAGGAFLLLTLAMGFRTLARRAGA